MNSQLKAHQLSHQTTQCSQCHKQIKVKYITRHEQTCGQLLHLDRDRTIPDTLARNVKREVKKKFPHTPPKLPQFKKIILKQLNDNKLTDKYNTLKKKTKTNHRRILKDYANRHNIQLC